MKANRLLAFVLSALMVFASVPFAAVSAEETPPLQTDNDEPSYTETQLSNEKDALVEDSSPEPLGDALVAGCEHSLQITETLPATAHRAGYTTKACSLCGGTQTKWEDATDGIVLFVDKDNGTATGIGTADDPFSTYGKAIKYADLSFDRTIVLMSMIGINQDFNEAVHTGVYTITSKYNGVKYDGGFDVNNGSSYYNVNGPDIFENLTIDIKVTAVWQARHNKLVMGEGIACIGEKSENLYLVGGVNTKSGTTPTESFAGKGTDLTILSGRYKEVVGGNRNGALNPVSGDIHLYIGKDAVIDKVFITTRNIKTGMAATGNSYVTLDGGRINYYVTSTDVTADYLATTTPKGAVTVKVTDKFVLANSFNAATDTTVRGIWIANVYKANTAKAMEHLASGTVKLHTSVFDEYAFDSKIGITGCNKISAYSDNVAGDIDRDDELTNIDMTLLIRHLSGWIVDNTVIDITEDGKVNNRDAVFLIQKLEELSEIGTRSIVFDNKLRLESSGFASALDYLLGAFSAAYGIQPSLKIDVNYKAEDNDYTVILGDTSLRSATMKINDYAYKILADKQVVINGGTTKSILAGVKKFSSDILGSSDGASSNVSSPTLTEGTKYEYKATYTATSATINGIDIKNFKIAIKSASLRADAEKLVLKLGAYSGFSIPIIDYSEISSTDKGVITLGTATRTNSETIVSKYNGYRLVVSDKGGYTLGVIGSSNSYYTSGYNKLISSIKATTASGATKITLPSETTLSYTYPWVDANDKWTLSSTTSTKTVATGITYKENIYNDVNGKQFTANILYVDSSKYSFYLGTPASGYTYQTVTAQMKNAVNEGKTVYAGINGDRWDTWLGTGRLHGLTIKNGTLLERGLWDGGVHSGNTLSDRSFFALTKTGEYVIGNHAGNYDYSKYSMAIGGDFLLTWKGVPQYHSDFYAYSPVDNDHIDLYQPRTMVGYTDDGDLILVTVDGRQSHSKGATMEQCADLMTSLGCYMAISLDGGGSTEMVIKEGSSYNTQNSPSDGSSRAVKNSLLIVKK